MKRELRYLILTYLYLLTLLALTVAASSIELGAWALPISLTIALMKTLAIVWIFMEIKTATNLALFAAIAAPFWLLFFYILAASDTLFRPHMLSSMLLDR